MIEVLHRLAANPWVYEKIQCFFGGPWFIDGCDACSGAYL